MYLYTYIVIHVNNLIYIRAPTHTHTQTPLEKDRNINHALINRCRLIEHTSCVNKWQYPYIVMSHWQKIPIGWPCCVGSEHMWACLAKEPFKNRALLRGNSLQGAFYSLTSHTHPPCTHSHMYIYIYI